MNINKFNLYLIVAFALLFGGASAVLIAGSSYTFVSSIICLIFFGIFALVLTRLVLELEKIPQEELSKEYFKKLSGVLLGHKADNVSNETHQISELFVPKIVEGAVASRAQLGNALADLMDIAFARLPLRGMEVALFDKSTSYYYFSLLMGAVPIEQNENIVELPLSFSGKVLGSVKFANRKGEPYTQQALELAKLITLQVGVLFVNAEYSSELLRMQRSTDESLKAKTGFLANLSHEVRAPLGVIINATELVLDGLCGEISSDQQRILGLAKKGSEHLLELIGDVLDYAKIEAGKLAPQKKDIAVQDILKDVTTLIRFQAEQKKLDLELKDNIEAMAVSVDRKHFRQMLINLLTNAVKYTPEGGKIEVWAERAAGKMIRINVKDSGVGIDATQRDKVFAPFERLNHSYSRQQAGVGLGLSLAKKLAEINGGSLDFESQLGAGSRFWVSLRSSDAEILDKSDEKVHEKSLVSNGEAIVIIDPDVDHLSILSRYLTDLGYKVKSFPNYLSASSAIDEGPLDLLIMENSEIDDSESNVAKLVSQMVEVGNVPLLLLSSRAFIFDLEKYLKLGVERCMSKPAPLKELAQICKEILDARRAENSLKVRDSTGEPILESVVVNKDANKDLLH